MTTGRLLFILCVIDRCKGCHAGKNVVLHTLLICLYTCVPVDVLFANRAERARDTYAATAGLLHTISCGMMLSRIVDLRDWLRAFYAVICALNLGEAVGEAASSSAVARVHVQFAMTVKVGARCC